MTREVREQAQPLPWREMLKVQDPFDGLDVEHFIGVNELRPDVVNHFHLADSDVHLAVIRHEDAWLSYRRDPRDRQAYLFRTAAGAHQDFDRSLCDAARRCFRVLWRSSHFNGLVTLGRGGRENWSSTWSVVWRIGVTSGVEVQADLAAARLAAADVLQQTAEFDTAGSIFASIDIAAAQRQAGALREAAWTEGLGKLIRDAKKQELIGRKPDQVDVSRLSDQLGVSRNLLHQVLRGKAWH